MKIMDDFCYKWKPPCAYHKIDTFHGEQTVTVVSQSVENSVK